MGEIQDISDENLQNLNQIYNLEDFYENNLLPKMYLFPHQYVSRMIASKNAKASKGSDQKENIIKLTKTSAEESDLLEKLNMNKDGEGKKPPKKPSGVAAKRQLKSSTKAQNSLNAKITVLQA